MLQSDSADSSIFKQYSRNSKPPVLLYARDTRSDKLSNEISWMENRVVCHTIRFLSYEVGWNAFKSIRRNQFIVRKRQYHPCALF